MIISVKVGKRKIMLKTIQVGTGRQRSNYGVEDIGKEKIKLNIKHKE